MCDSVHVVNLFFFCRNCVLFESKKKDGNWEQEFKVGLLAHC